MLVVGVASSALFDLSDSDKIFREYGEDEYRKHQGTSTLTTHFSRASHSRSSAVCCLSSPPAPQMAGEF